MTVFFFLADTIPQKSNIDLLSTEYRHMPRRDIVLLLTDTVHTTEFLLDHIRYSELSLCRLQFVLTLHIDMRFCRDVASRLQLMFRGICFLMQFFRMR